MNLGIGLGVTNYLRVPTAPLEDPDAAIAALFGSGEVGAWYDPSDSSTVWQDAAGTTPAAVGDPVGRIDDKSGNGNHATQTTSAARPVLQQSGDLYYLDFDGVDDSMAVTFAAAQAQPNSVSVGYRLDAVANTIIIDGSTTERHALYTSNGYVAYFAGIALVTGQAAAANINKLAVLSFDSPSSIIRIDGVAISSGDDVGSLSWGGVKLGSRYNDTQFTNARIYSYVGVNRSLTAGEITDLETYLAAKSGVTL